MLGAPVGSAGYVMGVLDDKLLSLINQYPVVDDVALVAQIKQAFADEGYGIVEINGKPVTTIAHRDGTYLFSGQEWYDRFIEEVQSLKFSEPGLPELSDVFKAARKASGIKETHNDL